MQTGFVLIKQEARSATGKEPQRQQGKCVQSTRYRTATKEKIKVALHAHEEPEK